MLDLNNKSSEILGATELSDLAIDILNNLDSVPTIESIVEIVELLPFSLIKNYTRIFETVVEFYNTNNKFPEISLLESKHKGMVYKSIRTFSQDNLIDFIDQLRTYKKHYDLKVAIDNYDMAKVDSIVVGGLKVDTPTEELTFLDIPDVYEEEQANPSGIMTGIEDIDFYLKGMDVGTLNVLAAPTGTFKTTTAVSIAYNASVVQGKKVAYLTLEVTPRKIMYNFVARHSYEMGIPISASALKKRELDSDDVVNLKSISEDLNSRIGNSLKVINGSDIKEYTLTYLETFIKKKMEEMGGLDLLVVDYIGLFKNKIPPSIKLDQYQAINYYVDFFHSLGIKLGFASLILAQITREGTQKLDRVGDEGSGKLQAQASTAILAEANSLERTATSIVMLYASRAMKNRGALNAFILKSRDTGLPEEGISTIVLPEYFKVGSDGVKMGQEQDIIMDALTTDKFNSVEDMADDLEF